MHMPSKSDLRVCLISYNFGEYCVQLANGLARHADVLLLLPGLDAGSHVAQLSDAVHLLLFPNPRFRQPIQQSKIIGRLFQAIHDFAPDVVHYQGGHPWFDLAVPFLRQYPLVLTIHDFKAHPGDRLSQKTPLWLETFARRRAQELIVHTRFTFNEVVREFPRIEGRTSIVPHIQIGQCPSVGFPSKDEHLVLFFGRIWEYKGLEYLIRAEPLITARVPEAKILIAGKGEDFSRYEQMMVHRDRFIVDNRFIPDDHAATYFKRASVVVLPYIEASQSGVACMAYSAGKPVVATAVGGLPEMVEDGRTGYLVPPRDVGRLAESITHLLLDADLRHQMGRNGKQKVESEWSPDIVARKTIEVYQRAIAPTAREKQRYTANSPTVNLTSTGDRAGNN